MPVPDTSREAYYSGVLSGRLTSHKDRIMRYLLSVGRPVTRHELVDRFFCLQDGNGGYRALDGGRPIHWQSAGGAIAAMVCRAPGCDHSSCSGYIAVDHIGECPVTHNDKTEFIVPIGDRWNQRRMF